MTTFRPDIGETEVDRLRELASIGAGHAATALSELLGHTCLMRVPQVRLLPAERISAPYVVSAAADERQGMCGVFFEVRGGLGGVLALLFPEATRDRLLEHLLGERPAKADSDRAQSALRELGNILASHAVSSLADTLGVAVLPSVPVLAPHDATTALASLVALRSGGQPALRVETEIYDSSRRVRGILVIIPDSANQIAAPPAV